MTRAENWELILRVCEQSEDDTFAAIRVPLLNDFCKAPFQPDSHCRHLLVAGKTLLFAGQIRPRSPLAAQRNHPLILVPHASGSNLLNLLPVAREAKNRGWAGLVVAGDGVDPEPLAEFESVVTERELWSLARRQGMGRIFRTAQKKFKKLVGLLEPINADYARRVRRNYGWFLRQLVVAVAMRDSFETLLADWQPSCVVSTSDYWPFEYQLFCAAKRMGIPTAIIQHGELTNVTCWPTYADTFLAWGAVFEQALLTKGAPASRVRVCGMPAADKLFNRVATENFKTVDSVAPVCLVFSHTNDRLEDPLTFANYNRFLREAIARLPRVRWRIRLHPAEDDSFYRELGLIGHPRVQLQTREVSLDESIAAADVVCTIRSTAGLQAMMLGRPLIVLDLTPEEPCSVWWPPFGGGLAVKDAEDFIATFDHLIDEPRFRENQLEAQREFLDQAFAHKGQAAAAIVDYLAEAALS